MQKNDATGWYVNVSKDKNGQPEALNLGVVTIRAGAMRFIEHRLIERSHNAFDNARKAGRLHGPLKSQAEAEKLLGISAPPVAPPPADDLPPVAPSEEETLLGKLPDDAGSPIVAPAAESSGEGAPVSDAPKPKKLGRR